MKCFEKLIIALNNIEFDKSPLRLKSFLEDIDSEILVYCSGLTRRNVVEYIEDMREHTLKCSRCKEVYLNYLESLKQQETYRQLDKKYLDIIDFL